MLGDKRKMSCKYNNCKHCGYKSECEIYKENAELKEALKNDKVCKCSYYLNFKDLEKGNVELKLRIDELARMCNRANERYDNVADNLTKAKELLKKFMKISEENGRQWNEEVYFEAREFLSEVEK